MVRRYFGTDGIRGRANRVITPELALKVGQAAGLIFRNGDHRHRVLIGKDTRLSGYMIENALVAGFTSVGMDVLLTGPIPTPGVAMLAHTMRAERSSLSTTWSSIFCASASISFASRRMACRLPGSGRARVYLEARSRSV